MNAYNPERSQKNELYRRKKYRRIGLDIDRAEYEEILQKAADKAGVAVGTYVKQAAFEKARNDLGIE